MKIYNTKQLQEILQQELQPSYIEVIDESCQHAGHAGANAQGWGSHIRVKISSQQLFGKTRIQAHRLIFAALEKHNARNMHALSVEIL